MTTKTPIQLVQGSSLQVSPAQLYVAPVDCVAVRITAATLTNNSSGSATAAINFVPNQSVVGSGNLILPNRLVVPNEPYVAYALIGHVLVPGESIWGSASVGGILNLFISGEEIDP